MRLDFGWSTFSFYRFSVQSASYILLHFSEIFYKELPLISAVKIKQGWQFRIDFPVQWRFKYWISLVVIWLGIQMAAYKMAAKLTKKTVWHSLGIRIPEHRRPKWHLKCLKTGLVLQIGLKKQTFCPKREENLQICLTLFINAP